MRRKIINGLALLVIVSGLFAIYIGLEVATGNMHAVVPGELYRSAQPTAKDIALYHRSYGIKTIINLRGANPDDAWYQEEIAASKALDINHFDLALKANHPLTPFQTSQLLGLMTNANKPILIHCRSGMDRTGLASAMYLAGVKKSSEWAAERQLWMHYGHLPFHFTAAYAMTKSFETLEPLFGFEGS